MRTGTKSDWQKLNAKDSRRKGQDAQRQSAVRRTGRSSQAHEPQALITHDEWLQIVASEETARESWLLKQLQRVEQIRAKVAKPIPSDPTPTFLLPWSMEQWLIPAQNKLLFKLLFKKNRKLNTEDAQAAIKHSAELDDVGFFVRLGTVLSEEPFDFEAVQMPKLADLLVSEWTHRRNSNRLRYRRPWLSRTPGNHTPLCFFTGPALVEYCRIQLDQTNLSDADVVKTSQRLGLQGATKKLVRSIRNRRGKLVYTGFSRR